MAPISPKRSTWTLALLLAAGAAACDGCPGRKASPPASAARPAGGPPTWGPAAVLASIPPGHELVEAVFSADGRHVAFVATKDGSAFAFLDATRYGPYQEVRGLVLPEGRTGLAFVARRDGKEFAVADGVEGAPYAAVERLRHAPDGRLVYAARRGDEWRVVAGDREVVVAGTDSPAPLPTADGKRVVYADRGAAAGKRALRACSLELTACVSGEEYDELDWPEVDRARKVQAFSATKDGKQTVVTVDLAAPGLVERTHGWFDGVALFATSGEGAHLAFLARRGDGHLLVKDGSELLLPAMDSPLDLVLSPPGHVLLTAIVAGKVVVFVDGQQAGGGHEGVYFPTFSPDGGNHAFVAERGPLNALVLKDGEGPTLDRVVTPRFTPDGAKVVYRARKDGERFVVVADARGKTLQEQPHYEAVFDVSIAPDGSSIGYGVRAGAQLWWKVEKL